MARITAAARRQFLELLDAYCKPSKGRSPRPQAARNLIRALAEAIAEIDQHPGEDPLTPRSYRGDAEIARHGYHWIKRHRYFFAHMVGDDGVPTITGIHFETSNIPENVSDDIEPISGA